MQGWNSEHEVRVQRPRMPGPCTYWMTAACQLSVIRLHHASQDETFRADDAAEVAANLREAQ